MSVQTTTAATTKILSTVNLTIADLATAGVTASVRVRDKLVEILAAINA